jgi:hypothetical protein
MVEKKLRVIPRKFHCHQWACSQFRLPDLYTHSPISLPLNTWSYYITLFFNLLTILLPMNTCTLSLVTSPSLLMFSILFVIYKEKYVVIIFLYIVIDKMRLELSNRRNLWLLMLIGYHKKSNGSFFLKKAMEIMWVS